MLYLAHLDVPKLPPMPGDADDEEHDELRPMEKEEPVTPPTETKSNKKKRETPKIQSPYSDESSTLLPIFVALAACVPFLFCLCKL